MPTWHRFFISSYTGTKSKHKKRIYMKIVVYRSPKALRKILYKLFGMKES